MVATVTFMSTKPCPIGIFIMFYGMLAVAFWAAVQVIVNILKYPLW
jgi:hypothetical protein